MIAQVAALLFTVSPQHVQSSWPLWTHYAERFVQVDGRVVDHDRDDLTTSEGQSYAMFFAIVANDQSRFDLLYRWTLEHLADGSLENHLPAWSWGHKDDGSWGIEDNNSASDADMWIAYDLIQAGRLWKRPDYTVAGQSLLTLIARREVVQVLGFPVLLPGHSGFEHGGAVFLNPSYMPLFLLHAADRAQPVGPWAALAASLPALLHSGSFAGFASDWITISPNGTIHPMPPPDSHTTVATGSYDAIRVYLWSGITDPGAPGRDAVLKELSGMTTYMRTHSDPPEFVHNGNPATGSSAPVSYSAALIPFLDASRAPAAAKQQERRLNVAWSPRTGLYGDPPRYYDQNLSMFALGFLEGRYRFRKAGELEVLWQK
jgi:endoglucanase